MGKHSNRKLIVYLPVVLAATFLVVVAPMLLIFWLRKSGVVTSAWVGMVIGVVVSFLAAYAGGAFWKTRTNSRDILFSELMLWGWVQRWRSERRLMAASDLLGLATGRPHPIPAGHLTDEQKAGLLTQLTSGLEARDQYTHGHSRRVARHASNIAKRMGLPREEVAKIRAAGAMHDVGKVETPIAVLHKEGKLTDEEYAIVKRHPVDGAAMVSMLRDDELTAMVRHHHERLDGTGYPDRLTGEAIPIGARILAVADTFDAITSTRPYRHANAHKKALDILVAEAGTQLDPDAVRAFCRCYSGRRPLAYWTILAHGRPRLASYLGSGLGTGGAGGVANVMATAAAAAALGSAALGPLVETPKDPPRALANAGASRAPSPAPARPQAGRGDEAPAPQARRDRLRNRRDRNPTPGPGAATVPAPAPVPEQGSGSSPSPIGPRNRPAGFEPRATAPAPRNRPVADGGRENDSGQGPGGRENGDPGPNRQDGRGRGKDNNGKSPGKGNGRGNDKGQGQDKVNGRMPDTGPGQGNGRWQGNVQGQAKGDGQAPDRGRDEEKGRGPVITPAPGAPLGQEGIVLPGGPPVPAGQGHGTEPTAPPPEA